MHGALVVLQVVPVGCGDHQKTLFPQVYVATILLVLGTKNHLCVQDEIDVEMDWSVSMNGGLQCLMLYRKACLHYKTVRTRFLWSRFQTVFTRPHWYNIEPVHVTRTRSCALIP